MGKLFAIQNVLKYAEDTKGLSPVQQDVKAELERMNLNEILEFGDSLLE